jgi:hypothetical protein
MYPGIILEPDTQHREEWFILNITNIGQRPILITKFCGIDKSGQSFIISPDHYDSHFSYPKTLKETENMSLKANIEQFKKRELKELGVYNSSRKNWKLSRKQIKDINKTSRNLRRAHVTEYL